MAEPASSPPAEAPPDYGAILRRTLSPEIFEALVKKLAVQAVGAQSAADLAPMLRLIEAFIPPPPPSTDEREQRIRDLEEACRERLRVMLKSSSAFD